MVRASTSTFSVEDCIDREIAGPLHVAPISGVAAIHLNLNLVVEGFALIVVVVLDRGRHFAFCAARRSSLFSLSRPLSLV